MIFDDVTLRYSLVKYRKFRSLHDKKFFIVASKKQKREDTFGMNDDDWEVYKYIVSEITIQNT